jgi:hypothetical protein
MSVSWSRNVAYGECRTRRLHVQTITPPGLCLRVLVSTWRSAFNLQLFLAPTINHQWNASRGGAATLLQRRVEVLHLPPAADKIINIGFYLHSFPKETKGRVPLIHDYKLICVCSCGPGQISLSLLRAIPEATLSGPYKWNAGIKMREIINLPRVCYGRVARSSTRSTEGERRLEGVLRTGTWQRRNDRRLERTP